MRLHCERAERDVLLYVRGHVSAEAELLEILTATVI